MDNNWSMNIVGLSQNRMEFSVKNYSRFVVKLLVKEADV